jgi:hypothetical protein
MIRPESITITIHPSEAGADTLSVADAMQQVLDAFELLSKAEARRPGSNQSVVWKLFRASTNSPLTIEAIAVSTDPAGDVQVEARQAKLAFQDGIHSLIRAREVPDWMDLGARNTVRRLLERTLSGIGMTDISLSETEAPIRVDHRYASRGLIFLNKFEAEEAAKIEDLTRIEYGSAEGSVTGTTTHYSKPTIKIRLRLSGREVKCVLSETAAAKIGPRHNWSEVWSGQRVLVRGRLQFDSSGDISIINAEDLDVIEQTDVPLTEIRSLRSGAAGRVDDHLNNIWGDKNG